MEVILLKMVTLTKEQYTEVFLKQAGLGTDEANIKYHMYNFWFKTSNSTGLRLSDNGYKFLTETLNLSSFEVPFLHTMDMNPSVIVFLSKYMDCPYLLKGNSIVVFSERKSLELYLFSGDIRRYGLVKAIAAQKKLSNKT
jgi:hypothetical protein